MAISTDQKVDYLWKKVGYGAAKRDVRTVLDATNEGVPSPLLLRGDNVLAQSDLIPSTIPNSDSGVVGVHTIGNPLEISSFDNNASDNRSWNTGVTDWISPEFGSTYVVKVYVHNSGDPSNAAVLSNQLFGAGSNNDDEWFFDYQAGTLNFIGENLPNGIDFTGKSVYVTGAYYNGIKGVAAPGAAVSFSYVETIDLNVTGVSTFSGELIDIDAIVDINGNITHAGIVTTRGLSIGIGTDLVGITTILDEDTMSSNSDIALATQQSIKAYVDDNLGNVSLGFTGDPGAQSGTIDLDSQLLSILGTQSEIETVSSGQTITIGLPNEVAITTSLTIGSVGIGTTTLTIGTIGIGTTALTIGSVGITSIDSDITGVSTQHDTLASAKAIKDYVDTRELTFGANTTNGTTQVKLDDETFTILGETDQIITSGIGQQLTVGLRTDVSVVGNLEVGGNVSIGGSNTTLSSVTLTVIDRDLVLGFNTDQYQNDASTDDGANHGGIAIASTEGNPLVSIQASGIITSVVDPNITDNYKKFMWFKKDTFTGLSTDAWLSNYAIGVGATQFANGTRFAVGTPNNYVSSGITREGTVSIAGTDRITGINTVDIIRGFEISADETIIESGTFVTEVGIGSIGISKGSVGVGTTDLTFGNRNRVAGIRMTDTDIDAFGKITANKAIFSSDTTTLGDDYSTLTIGDRPIGDGYASLTFKNNNDAFAAKIDGTSSGISIWGSKNSVSDNRFVWDGSASTEKVQLRPRGQTVLHAQHDSSNGRVGINSTSPSVDLDVNGGAHVSGNISVGSTTNIIRKVTDVNSWVAVDSDTSFSVTSQQNSPTGLYFKSNGTKMFVVGTESPRDVDEYALSSAWDITTASHTTGYSINSQDTSPQGLYFSPNGENMFVAGNSSDSILHYTLSTGWDLTSTVSYVGNFSVSSQAPLPTGVTFGDNGTKMYVVGRTNDSINQYNLSSAYTITSGVTHAHTLDIGQSSSIIGTPNGFANPHGISISSDGTKIWIIGTAEDIIAQFNLGTAYDLSTATYNGDFTNIFWAATTSYDFYIDESAEKGFILFAGTDDSVREIDITNPGLSIEANPTVRSANINLNNNVQVKGKTWFEEAIIVNGSELSYFQHDVQVQGKLNARGAIDLADGPGDRIQFGGSDDAKIYYDGTDNYFDLQFSTADNNGFRILNSSDSELFRVAKDGKVAIGTDTPDAKLEVRDASATGIIVRSDNTQSTNTNKALRVRNNSDTNTFHVSHKGQGYFAGDVGIGTTNPTEALDVNGNVVVSGFTSTSQLKVGVGTLGLVGITSILDEDNMSSDSNTALATQQSIKKYVDDEVSSAFGSVTLTFGDSSSTGTIDLDQQTLSIVGTTNEIATSASNQQLQISLPDDVVIGQDLTVQRNLTVDGTITVGGTSATLFTETLNVADADLILGVRTDGNGVDSSTDTTANHGGIAIASTEGNPLVTLVNPGAGETLPATYKKIMWFKKDSFTGLSTDAWISNYAIGIGTTQMATHEVLGVGGNTKIHGDLNISGKSVRGSVTGIGTTSASVSIHTLPKATYRSVEYNIQATQGSKYQSTKVLSIHNGSDAFLTQYGTIHTDGSISNYGSDISSNDFRLLAIAEGATEANPINYIVNFVATVV